MPIVINGTFDVRWPTLIDKRMGQQDGSYTVPYNDTAQALAALPAAYRAEGLVIYVKSLTGLEWWQFVGGIEDENLKKVDFLGLPPGATPGLFGITDNLGLQDRAINMQGFGLAVSNSSAVNFTATNEEATTQLKIEPAGVTLMGNTPTTLGLNLYLPTLPTFTTAPPLILYYDPSDSGKIYVGAPPASGGAVTSTKFGKAGEDATATENRAFALGAFKLAINKTSGSDPAVHVTTSVSGGSIALKGEGTAFLSTGVAGFGINAGVVGIQTGGSPGLGHGVYGNSATGNGITGESQSWFAGNFIIRKDVAVNSIRNVLRVESSCDVHAQNGLGAAIIFDVARTLDEEGSIIDFTEAAGKISFHYSEVLTGNGVFTLQVSNDLGGTLITALQIVNKSLVLNTMRTFASDAAADADTTLVTKSFYKITGNRTVFQKP